MGIRPDFIPKTDEAVSSVTRFEAGAVLSKLRSGGLLERGRAHIISVDAIRTAFGARWPLRKEVVWDMAEGQLLKRVGRQAFAARLSDTEFIVITPMMEPLESRALVSRVSKDLCLHFLGEGEQSWVSIKMVTDYADQSIHCRPLTDVELAEAESAGDTLAASRLRRVARSDFDDDLTVGERATPLKTVGGARLRFSTSVDPIIDLRQWAVAGHRIEPKIMDETTRLRLTASERRRLLPHDVASVDHATLRKGIERLHAAEPCGRRSTMILTVSFLTVSSSWALAELLAQIDAQTKAAMAQSVIWEIADFEAGVPAGRLTDCICALNTYGRAVFARAERPTLKANLAQALGRCGLLFQPEAEFEDEDDAADWLISMGRVIAKRPTTLVAANLPSKDLLVLASSVGFTHATMRQM